jgi:hypothetical protein
MNQSNTKKTRRPGNLKLPVSGLAFIIALIMLALLRDHPLVSVNNNNININSQNRSQENQQVDNSRDESRAELTEKAHPLVVTNQPLTIEISPCMGFENQNTRSICSRIFWLDPALGFVQTNAMIARTAQTQSRGKFHHRAVDAKAKPPQVVLCLEFIGHPCSTGIGTPNGPSSSPDGITFNESP